MKTQDIVGIGWSGAQPRAVTLMKYSGKAFWRRWYLSQIMWDKYGLTWQNMKGRKISYARTVAKSSEQREHVTF